MQDDSLSPSGFRRQHWKIKDKYSKWNLVENAKKITASVSAFDSRGKYTVLEYTATMPIWIYCNYDTIT